MTANADAAALLARIARGDRAAMERFYRAFEARVYRFALSRLNQPFDAADVLHEVMLEVWRNAGRFAGRSRVTTWLFGIAHHKVVDRQRRRGLAAVTVDDDPEELDMPSNRVEDDQETLLAAAQDAARVRDCLARLSPEHREILHLAFYEDLPYRDIARIVDCPEGTVKSRVHHAKRALARCLARAGVTS